jgi:glycosyltransferase involved in cell wall biosynthesis
MYRSGCFDAPIDRRTVAEPLLCFFVMPQLSVVMSVYNCADALTATLDSILQQTVMDFELLVVDDGSSDRTPAILAEYAARDSRLRVITQANAGLTRALIRGCNEARAEFIARHDCGDRSHPERFARQLAAFQEGVVLVSSAMQLVAPDGEPLLVKHLDGDAVRRSLLEDDVAHIRSIPHHGTAMFRRDAYLAAGGYREQFRVAQDVDLFVRLAKLGRFVILEEPLYDAVADPAGISSTSRPAQIRAAELIIAMRDGGDATTLLAEAARIIPTPRTARGEASGLYFIARCLRARRSGTARSYLLRAVRRNPLHWRAWASLVSGR